MGILIILFSLYSDARSPARPVIPEPPVIVIPAAEQRGKIKFEPVKYYSTPTEAKKIIEAGEIVNRVIQSECFYAFISHRQMIQTNGRSPGDVARHLQGLSGTVPVVMYYRKMGFLGTKAVAYRQPPELTINLNRAYFSTSLDTYEWASTMAHESVGHSLGNYGHDFKWNPQRDFSVPYSIGGASAKNSDAFQYCRGQP